MAIIDKIKQVIADEYGTRHIVGQATFLSNLVLYDMENEGSDIKETEINYGAHKFILKTVDGLRVDHQRPGVDDLIEIRLAHLDVASGKTIGIVVTMNYYDDDKERRWEIQRAESSD
ncbi:hypothetical protein [Paenibacillus pabuli]|uniref:hypothetical protein n=1 Tax=Paenibacillus pabuli TaxID=1472 RepID=UPI001FFF5960|nr:hypothetical protein [Paenibacillus pabuli]UPK45876.1 hypothetical protein KET34_10665 [Paenibacillus pabuli]